MNDLITRPQRRTLEEIQQELCWELMMSKKELGVALWELDSSRICIFRLPVSLGDIAIAATAQDVLFRWDRLVAECQRVFGC